MVYPFRGFGLFNSFQKFDVDVVAAAPEPFLKITTLNTSNFTLKTGFASIPDLSYTVDWGDGNTESSTATQLSHSYSSSGTYEIIVTPDEGTSFSVRGDGSSSQIYSISGTGGNSISATPWNYAFIYNNSMVSFDVKDTSNITSLDSAFQFATALTTIPQINTSNVTNFEYTWQGSSITSFPSIDCSSATQLRYTWDQCANLASFSPLQNTSNILLFVELWSGCSSLVSFPSMSSSWAQSAQTFIGSWADCTSLTTFPANMFDNTGTLFSSAFWNAFDNCALTAQSIENILVSLDTNGATGVTLGIGNGTNASYSTWSSAAQTALSNLQGKGWTVTYNP